MKTLTALLLLTCASMTANAQSAPPPQVPSEVTVLKFSWSKERIGWEGDPFSGPVENFEEMRVRTRNEKRIMDAKRSGNQVEMNKVEREARADAGIIERMRQQSAPRYGFLYKVSFKNNGTKAIKEIDWDYIFFDAVMQNEVGRHKFTSAAKIRPGKDKDFQFFIAAPPAKTISVQALNKNERASLGERVVLVRIKYEDGTVWEHPPL